MMFIELQCIRIALQLQQKPTVKISEHFMNMDSQVQDETLQTQALCSSQHQGGRFGKAQILQYQLVKIITNFRH